MTSIEIPRVIPRAGRVTVSVVVPMRNEAPNAERTLAELARVLETPGESFELLPVDDGSTDATWAVLTRAAASDPRIRPLRHDENRGRGAALRTGFGAARGEFVVTIDADLSYAAEHVPSLLDRLRAEPCPDLVVGSPYMRGGRSDGVPAVRLAGSRLGNWMLRRTTGRPLRTFTGILRGYRRARLSELDLTSEGKEIHLEILSQAFALGWRVVEIPAVLCARRAGRSKFRWRHTAATHLLHTLSERPLVVFGLLGTLLIVLGIAVLVLLLTAWRSGTLNPERPLMTVLLLFVLGGLQLLALGVVGTQMADIRRALFRLQRAVRARDLEDDGSRDDGAET